MNFQFPVTIRDNKRAKLPAKASIETHQNSISPRLASLSHWTPVNFYHFFAVNGSDRSKCRFSDPRVRKASPGQVLL